MSDVWYDEDFQVYETESKLWISKGKDGKNLVTSNDKQACIDMTRFYLKGKQEGFPESRVINDGKVGGKL